MSLDKKDLLEIDGVIKVTPDNKLNVLDVDSYLVEIALPNGIVVIYSISYRTYENYGDDIYDDFRIQYSYGDLKVKLESFNKPLNAQGLLTVSLKMRQLEDWAREKLKYDD